MFSICRYDQSQQPAWNAFVARAKNGLFLFDRQYMDYHADRFADHSVCIYRDGALFAVMPACEQEGQLQSHAGLTFGGIVSNEKMKTTYMLEIGGHLADYLRAARFTSFLYKCVPSIYASLPAEEDSYALFRMGALLARCEVTSVICRERPLQYAERRVRGIRKAGKQGLVFERSQHFEGFFELLGSLLDEKYQTRPTHTSAEMQLLAARFPASIVLWLARGPCGELLAGVVMYLHARVAHTQYMAASREGKQAGALDALLDHLIRNVYSEYAYFDFGISTEQAGHCLNAGLITQKEEFGARAIVHQSWMVEVN